MIARWFDALGTCRCGKPATGKLMSDRNDSLGPYCRKCAEARINKEERDAKKLSEKWAGLGHRD